MSKAHLREVMIEGKDLGQPILLHHNVRGTVGKRPLFVSVEPLENIPSLLSDRL